MTDAAKKVKVEQAALGRAVNRYKEVETAVATLRLDWVYQPVRAVPVAVKLGDSKWSVKLTTFSRSSHQEMHDAINHAVSKSVKDDFIEDARKKLTRLTSEKDARDHLILQIQKMVEVDPLEIKEEPVLELLAVGEKMGIDPKFIQAAEGRIALAEATQKLAAVMDPVPEKTMCSELAEALDNALNDKYEGDVVAPHMVKAAKGKLGIALATQELILQSTPKAADINVQLLKKSIEAGGRWRVATPFMSAAKNKLREALDRQGRRMKVAQRLQWRLEGISLDIESLEKQIAEAESVGVDADLVDSARRKLVSNAKDKLAEAKAEKRRIALEGNECDFYFLKAEKLRTSPAAEALPSLEEIKKDNPDWLVRKTLSRDQACLGGYAEAFCAVSYRHSNNATAAMKSVVDFLRHKPAIQYVWIDECCMAPAESPEHEGMLRNVYMLYLGASVLILLDQAYLGRFWTQYEAWLSMQKATTSGLRGASGDERRCTVALINGATKGIAQTLLEKWEKKPSKEVHRILSRPEVECESPSDKEMQLPIILKVEDVVRGIASEVAKKEEAAAKAWAEMEQKVKLMPCKEVLEFMSTNPEEAHRMAAGLTRLGALCKVVSNAQVFYDGGGFGMVARAMKNHAGHAGVQEGGCNVVHLACAANDASTYARRSTAYDSKLNVYVTNAMSAYETNVPLLLAACNVIHYMCAGEDGEAISRKHTLCADNDALTKVATAMWSYPHSAELQEAGGAALRALCAGEDPFAEERRQQAVDVGCLASIVQALTSHTRKENVQLWGMSALRAICAGTEASDMSDGLGRKHMAAEEGCLTAVIRGMGAHAGSERVQEEGMAALAAMCGGESFICKQAAVNDGAFAAIIKGMRSHSGDVRVQYAGCLALQCICAGELTDMSPAGQINTEARQKAAADAGTLNSVVKALKSHGGNAVVKAVGHAALQSITFNNAKLVALAIKTGAKKEWL